MLAAKDPAPGCDLCFEVTASVALAGTGVTEVTIEIVNDDNVGLDSGSDTVIGKRTFAVADLAVGVGPVYVAMSGTWESVGKRYLGLRFITQNGNDFSAGTVNAYLTAVESLGHKNYPKGWSVS